MSFAILKETPFAPAIKAVKSDNEASRRSVIPFAFSLLNETPYMFGASSHQNYTSQNLT